VLITTLGSAAEATGTKFGSKLSIKQATTNTDNNLLFMLISPLVFYFHMSNQSFD
jgi:hypothetical protein